MAESKNIVWSKTFWVSIIVALIGILSILQTLPLNESTLGIVVLIIGLLGLYCGY